MVASVLSGNRNFEARVHQNIKANFLMSPPLVVAFALAGRVDIDLTQEPLGQGRTGSRFTCATSGRRSRKSAAQLQSALQPEVFRQLYQDFAEQNPKWNEIPASTGSVFAWDAKSTYIQEPPFFEHFSSGTGQPWKKFTARARWEFLVTRVTTDHISPAGSIKKSSPAGTYLRRKRRGRRRVQQLRFAPRQ